MSEFEKVYEEANRRLHRYQHSGVRGQAVTPRDSLEYWVWVVTEERCNQPDIIVG